MQLSNLAFLATLLAIANPTLGSKKTKLLITSGGGKDVQVVDFENPDLTCTLKPNYLLAETEDISYPASDHCTIFINDNEALVTGGRVFNRERPKSLPKISKSAKLFSNGQWYNAPSMKVKRVNHGCGHFMHGQNEVFVVAGGENRFYELSSTELSTKTNGRLGNWFYGPRLPNRMKKLTLVSARDTVYVLPAEPGQILKLKCTSRSRYLRSCQWVETGQELRLTGGDYETEWIEDDQMVDCQAVTTTTTTTTTTTPRPRPRITDANNPNENAIDLDRPILSQDANPKDICGLRYVPEGGASKIVGGRSAHFGDWPWQVSLRNVRSNRHWCGGSILDKNWIVTAAHCVHDEAASDLIVRVGEHHLEDEDHRGDHQDIRVAEVIYHRDYTGSPNYDYDIAVLRLREPIQFQPHVVPVCLPPDNQDFTGEMGTVTGWGHERKHGVVQDVLKQVNVPILDNDVCTELWRKNGHYETLTDRMVCGGILNGGRDTCQADSGGPMVTRLKNGRYALVGVTSWGHGCGLKAQPGVYARVTNLKEWILEKTGY